MALCFGRQLNNFSSFNKGYVWQKCLKSYNVATTFKKIFGWGFAPAPPFLHFLQDKNHWKVPHQISMPTLGIRLKSKVFLPEAKTQFCIVR